MTNRRGGGFSSDRGPFAHIPPFHKAAGHVGIGAGKVFSHLGRVAFEEQDCAIDGIGERAAEEEFAPVTCFPREFQVDGAELRTPSKIVFSGFVKQEVMHGFVWFLRGRYGAALSENC